MPTSNEMNYDEMIQHSQCVEDFIVFSRNIDNWYRIPREARIVRDIFTAHVTQLCAKQKNKIAFLVDNIHLSYLQHADFQDVEVIAYASKERGGNQWGKATFLLSDTDFNNIDAIFVMSGTVEDVRLVEEQVEKQNCETQVIDLFHREFFVEHVLSVYVDEIAAEIKRQQSDDGLTRKTQVLYLTYDVIVNVLKQSLYLRNSDQYQTSLFKLGRIRENTKDAIAYESYFDKAFCFFNSDLSYWLLAKVLQRASFDIVYANVYFHTAYLPVFAKQFTNAKVVFELKDSLQLMTRDELYQFRYLRDKRRLDMDYDMEKYAYENMDGLVYKEKENYTSHFMEPIRHIIPTLSFRSYACKELYADAVQPPVTETLKHKLIFSSTVAATSIPNQICPAGRLMFEIFEELLHAGFEISAFGGKQRSMDSDWGLLNKSHDNFHLLDWHSVNDVVKLQAQKGFGILLFKNEENQVWGQNVWQVGIGEKLYSYIESGTPVIITTSRKAMCELVEEYGIGIALNPKDIPNLKTIIARYDYEKMRQNVLELRERIANMGYHIERLDDFFKTLINKEKESDSRAIQDIRATV